MAIKDEFLNKIAETIDSNPVINFQGYSEELQSTDFTTLTFPDEIGARMSFTTLLQNNTLRHTSVRTGGDVVDTVNGDAINSVAWFSASSGGDALIVRNTPNIVHTVNFDLQSALTLTFERKN